MSLSVLIETSLRYFLFQLLLLLLLPLLLVILCHGERGSNTVLLLLLRLLLYLLLLLLLQVLLAVGLLAPRRVAGHELRRLLEQLRALVRRLEWVGLHGRPVDVSGLLEHVLLLRVMVGGGL